MPRQIDLRYIFDRDNFILWSLAMLAVGLGSYFAGKKNKEIPIMEFSPERLRLYPVESSLLLVALDAAIKLFGAKIVNISFIVYFALAGITSIWIFLRTFSSFHTRKIFTYPYSTSLLTEFIFPTKPLPFYLHDFLFLIPSILINVYYYITRKNWANNCIAFSIAFYGVISIRIRNFSGALPLLVSLLVYDAFFVYSTDVMSSVAESIQGPVKLQLGSSGAYSVLGLGDLVIPGFFLSVCSRFDSFMKNSTGRWSPYWFVGMIMYGSALLLTDVVCAITSSGQPALVFIVPLLIIPTLLMVFIRREYYAFLNYSG